MDKKLKKVLTSIKSRAEGVGSASRSSPAMTINGVTAGDGSSDGQLLESIQSFCETGGPGNSNPGDEFLYLPTIVDIAESTPASAALAAAAIRKNLDLKHASRPYVQYNSVMLMRILAQNPGPLFTRHLADPKFCTAAKELLRHGRDPSVHQMLCETLDHFAVDPARVADDYLTPLRDLWLKEKQPSPPRRGSSHRHRHQHQHQHQHQQLPLPPLPPPPPPHDAIPSAVELAARISEANTSASLLQQLVESTPQAELVSNELIKEFADRCKLASRSMQAYITAAATASTTATATPPAADTPTATPAAAAAAGSAPPPELDTDTLTTLIETNDVLSMALAAHREAVAAALKARETAASPDARLASAPDLPQPHMRGAVGTSEPEAPVSPLAPTRHREADSAFRF